MIDITTKAAAINRIANEDYWSVLLSAFQLAAFQHGFDFSTEWEPCVLDQEEKETLGRPIVAARRMYLMPKCLSNESYVEGDVVDGYAESLVDTVIGSLIGCGIYLKRKQTKPLDIENPNYEQQTVFARVIARKALNQVEDLERTDNTWHYDVSFGQAIGYLDALTDLGLLPSEAKKELVYRAEVAYNRPRGSTTPDPA